MTRATLLGWWLAGLALGLGSCALQRQGLASEEASQQRQEQAGGAPAYAGEPASGEQRNYLRLDSEPGDYVGGGRQYRYGQLDAVVELGSESGSIAITVQGDQLWTGHFAGPAGIQRLSPGRYADLQRWLYHDPTRGGLDWSGEGRGCNELDGWFEIDSINYDDAAALIAVALRFEQHCEHARAALRGELHWDRAEQFAPSEPIDPPPGGLWSAAAADTPASGWFVYLKSDAKDVVGAGQTQLYTSANARLSPSAYTNRLSIALRGDQQWAGEFVGPDSLRQLQPGYYADLQRYPFHNPLRGGLYVTGAGRSCDTLHGWFVLDSIQYSGTALRAFELRFEQRCAGDAAALHGQVRWSAANASAAAGSQ